MEKGKSKSKKIMGIVIAIVLVIGTIVGIISGTNYMKENEPKNLNWEEIILADEIPQIQSEMAQIKQNTEEKLQLIIHEITEEEMLAYVTLCNEHNFMLETIWDPNTYEGKSINGGTLRIVYSPDASTMTISFTALPKVNWEGFKLGEYLPKIESEVVDVQVNQSDQLNIIIYDATNEQFSAYVQDCKEYGFNLGIDSGDGYYVAYNEENYKLYISFGEMDTGEASMSISVDAPIEIGKIKWPGDDKIVGLLPVPKSKKGVINFVDVSGAEISIGETTKGEYDEYVQACKERGFTVNAFSLEDTDYSANNEVGYNLNLWYDERTEIMTISISHPDYYE